MSVAVPIAHESIPTELLTVNQWAGWCYETDEKGKKTKVPKNPHTGWNASSTDASTWGSYEQAIVARDRYRWNGISFAISDKDQFFFVDLDMCINPDGSLISEARETVDALPDCYWERSPSGTGLHGIGIGSFPVKGNRRGKIEMYQFARFATITGDVFEGRGTIGQDCTNAITAVHRRMFGSIPTLTTPATNTSPLSTALVIIDLARTAKNGSKFIKLMNGDSEGYHSDSEADAALAAVLAFYTQDRFQIEQIMRLSGLQRGKWDTHKTYLSTTIEHALGFVSEHYTPPSTVVNINTRMTPKDEQPAEEKGQIRLTDIGNAQRFALRVKGKAHYCHAEKRWKTYDGKRWGGDDRGRVQGWAKESALSLYDLLSSLPADQRGDVLKHARRSESERSLRAAINLAESEPGIPILPSEFDQNQMLLNVANGTVDLETGNLRPHDPADMISKLAAVTFDPAATCPQYMVFIDQIFEGNRALIDYVKRVLGYCLTGRTNERAIFGVFGEGQNGKTTLTQLVMDILADYATKTPTETIMAKRYDGGIPNDIAALHGARFVAVSETEDGRRLNVAKVKDMAGNEDLVGRFLHGEFFKFRPRFKLWISTNHRPVVNGSDRALFDRLRLIPFNYRVPDDQKDTELESKLRTEANGILNWMIEGCLEWQRIGLQPPSLVTEATEAYRIEMDQVGNFLGDSCTTGDDYQVSSGSLYTAYRQWCEATSEEAITQNSFSREITRRGFEIQRRGKQSTRTILGLSLNSQLMRQPQLEADALNPSNSAGQTHADANFRDFSTESTSRVEKPGTSDCQSINASAVHADSISLETGVWL